MVFNEGVSLAIGLRIRATSADWAATEFVYKKHTTDLFWMVLVWSSIKTNSICRRGLLQSDKESFLDRCKLRQKRDPVFFTKNRRVSDRVPTEDLIGGVESDWVRGWSAGIKALFGQ